MKIIVADSSTLIALLDTNNISLLFGLFDGIIVTSAVYREITEKFNHKETVDGYISSHKLQYQTVKHEELYEILSKRLDNGESESIALAKERQLPLIIDERKGRSVARSLGIPIIGLIGIMIKLIEKEIISKPRAIEIIEEIEANDFRLSDGLKSMIRDF